MAGSVDFLSDLAAVNGDSAPNTAPPSESPFLADLAKAPQATPTQTVPQQSPLLGPALSALVRPIVKAASSIPYMAADSGVALGNILSGRVPLHNPDGSLNWQGNMPATAGGLPLPSQGLDQSLNAATTQPTGLGKGAEFVSTALLSGKLPMPTGIPQVPGLPSAAAGAQSALTGAQQQAMDAAAPLGFRVTPGQALGSTPLRQFEARLESQPLTSGPFAAIKQANQAALDRQAALSIGEDAPNVDSTVLGRADERLGKAFEDARSPSRIVLPDPKATTAKLDAIDSDLEGLVPEGTTIRSNPLVARLESLTQAGAVNGKQLGQISSKLGRAAFKQMTGPNGDRDMGLGLYQVKDHVDDLLQSAMSPQDASSYAAARFQYRNLMNLTSRLGIVNPSTGSVSGANYANRLQQIDRQGFLYGNNQSPLYNALRFTQAFKPIVGDSGTATRSSHGLFSAVGPLIGAALGGGAGHAMGHGAVEGAGAGALAMPALMNLGARAYLSRPGFALLQGARALPPAIAPAVKPALLGGLLAAQ